MDIVTSRACYHGSKTYSHFQSSSCRAWDNACAWVYGRQREDGGHTTPLGYLKHTRPLCFWSGRSTRVVINHEEVVWRMPLPLKWSWHFGWFGFYRRYLIVRVWSLFCDKKMKAGVVNLPPLVWFLAQPIQQPTAWRRRAMIATSCTSSIIFLACCDFVYAAHHHHIRNIPWLLRHWYPKSCPLTKLHADGDQ